MRHDVELDADGFAWLFAGDPDAAEGTIGWVAPGFDAGAELVALDAQGQQVASFEVALPVAVGAAPEVAATER